MGLNKILLGFFFLLNKLCNLSNLHDDIQSHIMCKLWNMATALKINLYMMPIKVTLQSKFCTLHRTQLILHLRSISLAYTSPYNIKYGSRNISLTICHDFSEWGFLIACRATPKLINIISSITRKFSMSITCGRKNKVIQKMQSKETS